MKTFLRVYMRNWSLIKRVFRNFCDEWSQNQIPLRASALTYTTVLSMIPALAVCFFIFTQIPYFADFQIQLKDYINQNLVSGTNTQVIQTMESLLAKVKFEAIGLAGSAFLLLTGVLLLSSIEASMNKIWRIPVNKGFLRRFVYYGLFLLVAPIAIALSIATTTYVVSHAPEFIAKAKWASYITGTVILSSLYYFLPNTNTKVFYAVISAILAIFLIENAKWGFAIYTKQSILYGSVYGSIAAFPILLLWIYLNWLILLSGTQLHYILQNTPFYQKIGKHSQWTAGPIFHKERAMLVIHILEQLKKDKNKEYIYETELYKSIPMPNFAIANALEWLRRQKWIKIKTKKMRKIILCTKIFQEKSLDELYFEILGVSEKEFSNNKFWESIRRHANIDE